MDPGGTQSELDFSRDPQAGGYGSWLEERRQATHELASRLGLPLGRRVEVWLRGNIRLRGALRLREERLILPEPRSPDLQLVVDGVPFVPAEIESCLRLD